MAVEKPSVGDTSWGSTLNTFLNVGHNSDGTHDDNTGFFNYDGSTVVYNESPAAANTWYDCDDITGTIGTNRALLILQVSSTAACYVSFKDTDASGTPQVWGSDDSSARGCQHVYLGAASDSGIVFVPTSATGTVQIATNNASATITATLIGYIK